MIADPGQTTNVAPENPKILDRLANAYQAWFSDVVATLARAWDRPRSGERSYESG